MVGGGGGGYIPPLCSYPQIIKLNVIGVITLLGVITSLNRSTKRHTPVYLDQIWNDECSSSKTEGFSQK